MNAKEAVEKIGGYWDSRAFSFDEAHDTENLEAWKQALSALLGWDRNKNVLDLGTGTGFLANMTAEMGYPTVGMDISEGMMRYGVRHADRRNAAVMYMTGSALELPCMDNTVDRIINARLIWTLVEPETALKEWLRVLRPGGKVFCFNRMEEGVGLTTGKHGDFAYNNEEIDGMLSIKSASMDALIQMMEECGFEDVGIRKLPGLTREGYDYDPWFVWYGTKPVTEREKTAKAMSEFWDKSAETYEARHELADKPHWQKVLSGMIGPDRSVKILDVATGTGMIAHMLASAGYESVTGADLSEGMMRIAIRRARESGLRIDYFYANALELPCADESLDVVISSRLLWTLSEPENAIREWLRVLRPGGKIIAINEMEPEGIRSQSFEDRSSYLGKGVSVESFGFANASHEEILATLRAAGAENVREEHLVGCRMVSSHRENWYAFIGTKNEA